MQETQLEQAIILLIQVEMLTQAMIQVEMLTLATILPVQAVMFPVADARTLPETTLDPPEILLRMMQVLPEIQPVIRAEITS
jgi:hypothetical protein